MTRYEHSGNAPDTTADGGLNIGELTLELGDGTGYPTGAVGPFWLVLDPGTASEEKVLCDSRVGTSVAINPAGRGGDGTAETDHADGAVVRHCLSATEVDEANAHVAATGDVHGVVGALASDAALQAEITARQDDTSTLTGLIDTEAADRDSADTTNASATTAVSDRVTTLENQTLNNRLDTLEGQSLNNRIDTLEAAPAFCHAYRSSSDQTVATSTWEMVLLNGEVTDSGTMHDTGSDTSRIIAPTDGLYMVVAQVEYATNATGFRILNVRKNSGDNQSNGTSLAYESVSGSGSFPVRCNASAIVRLSATDYVQLFTEQNSGAGLALQNGQGNTYMQLVRLGN